VSQKCQVDKKQVFDVILAAYVVGKTDRLGRVPKAHSEPTATTDGWVRKRENADVPCVQIRRP